MSADWNRWFSNWSAWARRRVRGAYGLPPRPARLSVEQLEDRVVPTGGVNVAAGDTDADGFVDLVTVPDAGQPAFVRVVSGRDGSDRLAFFALDALFLGGATVAVADVTGDGAGDIVVGVAGGGLPIVRVFDGKTGADVRTFFAFDPSFTGGIRVAAGDINRDGFADIVVGTATGSSLVGVYDGRTGAALAGFLAFGGFGGGVSVAVGDVNADGTGDLVIGAGPGAGPHVRVVSGADGRELHSFFAYSPLFRGGVTVAADDLTGDGAADLVVTPAQSTWPHVVAFDGRSGQLVRSFLAFDPRFQGGVRLATADLNRDGFADLVSGAGEGGNWHVRAHSGASLAEFTSFFAYFPFQLAPGFPLSRPSTSDPNNSDGTVSPPVSPPPPVNPPPNTAPLISDVPDQVTVSGGTIGPLPFTIGDAETPDGNLSVSASSSDPVLVPVANVVLGGTGATRTLTVSPALGRTGTATLIVTVTDAGWLTASDTVQIRVEPSDVSAEAFLRWNDVLLAAVATGAKSPPAASRAMAMLNATLNDVAAAFNSRPGYLVSQAAPTGADERAAVAAAAHRILSALFPAQQSLIDAERNTALAAVTDGTVKDAGIAFGQSVADTVIQLRQDDGSSRSVTYTPPTEIGSWVPTPPAFAAALLPQWATVTPFALDRPDQFRPPAPPALDSADWKMALAVVTALGQDTSATRTADQTEIAKFWADGGGTVTPPGHWLRIATDAARDQHLDAWTTARMLAELSVALADAAIAAWDAKYTYSTWRPITAVRGAAGLNDPTVTPDPTWAPLLTTPNHPEYVSGHSTFSRAAATVLEHYFGTSYTFADTSAVGGAPVTRTFASFDAAAAEAGQSRIYGGIHFQFSNQAGQALGRSIAELVLQRFAGGGTTDRTPPVVTLTGPTDGVLVRTNPTITGTATDVGTGVALLQAATDTGGYTDVSVGAGGAFSYTPALPLGGAADGAHTVRFRALDRAGQFSALASLSFTLDSVAPLATVGVSGTIGAAPSVIPVTFSEPVSDAGFATGAYTLTIGGTTVPIQSVERIDGSTVRLVLAAPLADGAYALTVLPGIADAAGNPLANSGAFPFSVADPVGIAELSPTNGEELVSLTRETVVRFDGAIDPTTVTPDSFYLIANGERVLGHIRVSSTNRFATFFYDAPLPASTEVRAVVDGNVIKGVGELAVDADGDDVPGGVATADFRTLPLTFIPGTRVWGYIYDSYNHTFDGSNIPIQGVRISLDADPRYFAVTDADGFFELGLQDVNGDGTPDGLPAPEFFVHIDGGAAVGAPAGTRYATLGKPFHSVPGQRVQLEMDGFPFDIFLPPMAMGDVVALSPTTETVVGFGAAGEAQIRAMFASDPAKAQLIIDTLKVTYPAGSAQDANGTAATQATVIPVPPDRLPAPLPPGVNPQLVISVQAGTPAGFNLAGGNMNFDTPAPVTFPNLDGLAPGEKATIMSFDHDAGEWRPIGTATVSADGKSIVSDPGVGILAPGWHFLDLLVDVFGRIKRFIGCGWDELRYEFGQKSLDNAIYLTDIVPWEQALLRNNPYAKAIDAALSIASQIGPILKGIENPNTITAETMGGLAVSIASATLTFACPLCWIPAAGLDIISYAYSNGIIDVDFNGGQLIPIRIDWERLEDTIRDAATSVLDLAKNLLACAGDAVTSMSVALRAEVTESEPVRLLALQLADFGDRLLAIADEIHNDIVQATKLSTAINYLAQISWDNPEGTTDPAIASAVRTHAAVIQDALAYFNGLQVADLTSAHSRFRSELVAIKDAIAAAVCEASAPSANVLVRLSSGLGLNTDASGTWHSRLPAYTAQSASFYDASSRLAGVQQFTTGAPGSVLLLQPSCGVISNFVDGDQDGLGNLAEAAIGTNIGQTDTDGDGISDFAEIQQGLDPLGGRGFPTGVIASLALRGEARSVTLAGSVADATRQLAYVATGSYGLAVVDASNFQNPTVLGQLDLAGTATDVAVDPVTNIAVVAANDGGLHFVNVADPMLPRLVRTAGVATGQVEILGGVAVAPGNERLYIYDPLSSEILTATNFPTASSVTGMAHEGNVLYVLDSNRRLSAFELADLQLVARGTIDLPQGTGAFQVSNGVAYIPVGSTFNRGGFVTVDVRNPDAMSLISASDVGGNLAAPGAAVVTNGSGTALLAGTSAANRTSVDVLNVRDPQNTNDLVTGFALPGQPSSIAIASGIGYVATGTGGLQVVNYLSFDTQRQPPTVSITGPTGTTADEGSRVPLGVTVTDDVQVRNVELLVNGRVVANAVSAPFELAAVMPTLASGVTTVTLQVRATDTGGNSSLSNVLTHTLTPDSTPPTLLGSVPADGGAGFQVNAVTLRFNEPIDPSLVSLAGFTLTNLGADNKSGGGDDTAVPIDRVEVLPGNRVVVYLQQPAPDGRYQLRVDPSVLADAAGNHVGSAVVTTFTSVDLDVANAVVWSAAGDGNWSNPDNWSTADGAHRVPGANDTAIIDVRGRGVTVTITDARTVRALIARDDVVITGPGASLTVTGTSVTDGGLVVTNAATLLATGPNAEFTANGATNVDGATLAARNGGKLRFPTVTSYTHTAVNVRDVVLQATGAGSILDLRNAVEITGGSGPYNRILVEAQSGGVVDLRSVVQITDPPIGNSIARAVYVTADGANSAVNLSALTLMTDRDLRTDNGSGNGASYSILAARNGGAIQAPNLKTLDRVQIALDGTGTIPVGQITTFTNGSLSVARAGYQFTTLTNADGTSIAVSGPGASAEFPVLTSLVNGGLTLSGGGMVSVPLLVSANGAAISVSGPGAGVVFPVLTAIANGSLSVDRATVSVPALANIDGANVFVTGGVTLSLPQITSYTHTSGGFRREVFLRATGSGSVLDLRNATQITNGAVERNDIFVEALSGGTVDLRSVVEITESFQGFSGGRRVVVSAAGTDSRIDLSALRSVIDINAGTPFNDPGELGTSVLQARAGGAIVAPNLTSAAQWGITLDGTGSLPVAQIRTFTGGFLSLSGAAYQFTALTDANGTAIGVSGPGASASFPALVTVANGSLSVSGGATADVPEVANIDGANVLVAGGVTVSLPKVTSYTHTSGDFRRETHLRATGAGSVLDLSKVELITNGPVERNDVFVEALSGGVVDLRSVVQITESDAGFTGGRRVVVSAEGTNSRIDLSALQFVLDRSAGTPFNDPGELGLSVLTARNGGTLSVSSTRTFVINTNVLTEVLGLIIGNAVLGPGSTRVDR